MDKIIKFYETEVKSTNDKDRTITITASKQVVDRDGDIVKVSGINTKNYKKNPVVMVAHNYSELPIGRAVGRMVWVEGDELKMKIEFAPEDISPRADTLFKLYKGGFMKGWSIGFLPNNEKTEWLEKHKSGARRIFNEVELLEVSAAPIPANQEALGASIGKAFEKGAIDEDEKKDLEEWMASEFPQDEIVPTDNGTITKLEKELTEKDIKIAELELQLKEQQMEEEIDEYDNYLGEIFEEFNPAGSDGSSADAEQMGEDWIDEALTTLEGDK